MMLVDKCRLNASRSQRGSALVLSLLVILAVLFLGSTFLSVALTDRKIAGNEADAVSAFEAAQAGIEDARAALPTTNVNTVLGSGGALLTNVPLGVGSYSVSIANNVGPRFPTSVAAADPGGATNDTDGVIVLTSTGRYRRAQRRAEVVVLIAPPTGFPYAFWASSKITISSSGFTDAYDSSVGAYNPGAATNNGNIFCNGSISLSGSSMVKGDAATASSTPANPSHVLGSSSANAPSQTIAAVACPGSFTPAADVPSGPGITYNAATGDLTVSGGNNVTLSVPPTQYSFNKVTLSGGSTMTLNNPSATHVDMYIADKMTASGGGVMNTNTKPTALTLYACGAGTGDWTLSGGSGAYFAVHAPTRKLTISGSGDLWGAIIAKEITSSGGSKLHYDMALGGGGGNATVVPRSWRELF